MYHEIEGQFSIEPIIFDDGELIARGKHYPYDDIESLEITSSQLFSPYGILTLRTQGRDIPIPFVRSRKAKLELALKDFKKLREGGGQDAANVIQGRPPAAMDPYEELKKLKELLDLDIITKEEFDKKKKKLLDL
ncbi:MAG: SHOCT domain-containing protein [Mogibacterium sp.]|nr:SHOCT domain-containing protein [Mogibacterium sp.]